MYTTVYTCISKAKNTQNKGYMVKIKIETKNY